MSDGFTHSLPRRAPEIAFRAGEWTHVVRGAILAVASAAAVVLFGHLYGVVALALVWVPYVFSHPREGLWITPALVMVASLISPPEGFQWGAGYSPELVYWAIGISLLFGAMLLSYLFKKVKNGTRLVVPQAAPWAFYAFLAASFLSGAVGMLHGYSFANVAKQFFGCALLCGYFLFALKFAPTEKDIDHVLSRTFVAGALCSIAYLAIYLYGVPELGFRKDLTILSTYAGGMTVLLLPKILNLKNRAASAQSILLAAILFAVPLLAQFKRAIAATVICGFLTIGMRAKSKWRRYAYLLAAFLVFTALLSTGLVNPIGAWFSKYPALHDLFPEDVQSHYSVFLRAEEFRQVFETLGTVPILGTGLGSTFSWYDPITQTIWEQETLDVGWLYLLAKMGIVGTFAFIWFVGSLSRKCLKGRIGGTQLSLFLLVVFLLLQLVADTTFVYFMTAAWAGVVCGCLHVMNGHARVAETSRDLQA